MRETGDYNKNNRKGDIICNPGCFQCLNTAYCEIKTNQRLNLNVKSFDGVKDINHLNLAAAKINFKPDGLAQLKNLERLEIKYNCYTDVGLVVFDGEYFKGLSNLKNFKFKGSGQNEVLFNDNCFQNFRQLENLEIENIRVFSRENGQLYRRLPQNCLGHLNELTKIAFVDCDLTEFDSKFYGIGSQVRSINLAKNYNLKLDPKCFKSKGSLEYLNLSNSINVNNSLPKGFFSDLGNLTQLDLSHNPYEVFANVDFSELKRLRYINADGCNCKVGAFDQVARWCSINGINWSILWG